MFAHCVPYYSHIYVYEWNVTIATPSIIHRTYWRNSTTLKSATPLSLNHLFWWNWDDSLSFILLCRIQQYCVTTITNGDFCRFTQIYPNFITVGSYLTQSTGCQINKKVTAKLNNLNYLYLENYLIHFLVSLPDNLGYWNAGQCIKHLFGWWINVRHRRCPWGRWDSIFVSNFIVSGGGELLLKAVLLFRRASAVSTCHNARHSDTTKQ